jgi:protein SCO1/2
MNKPYTKAMKSIYLKSLTLFIALVIAVSCTVQDKPLPIFGERLIENGDTIFHTIAPFEFRDQDSVLITNETVKGKIYVADFFFTSCRTICPKMKAQMLRVYEATANQEDFLILSHTIDPEYDDVTRLHDFAERLDVESKRWHFLTGVRDSIFKIAQTSYFATAMADEAEPDGYIHSGAFLLIDKEGRIRGKYDGTVAKDVDKLIADIKRLRFQEK